ncbi:MAG: ATP-binding protein [Bryobacteraceae bacterium]|jgi:light-regulated signal transduction histidine kinase (bacteriophytochrome)
MSAQDPSFSPPDAERLLAEVEELRGRLREEKIRHCDELRQFAYAVSHDLREPLRMVKSYTQLLELRREQDSPADRREFAGHIADAVERAERLLTDLVTYTQQLGALDRPNSLVDAEAVLTAVILNMEKSIRDSGARVTYDSLSPMMFDFDQLTYLFRELIANAIKFRAQAPPEIHISASASEEGVTFSVRDNGVGIEPRDHGQIFGVFKRLHGREYPGTGMGLAVSKRIVEQHGGTIWVESEAGHGATFRFTLPQ